MVFQNILDMFIFPDSVMEMEIDYYMEQLHPYGIPLDVRRYEGERDAARKRKKNE